MKKVLYSALVVISFYTTQAALPTCITLQPDAAAGKDAVLHGYSATQNYGTQSDIIAERWTWNGSPNEMRSLLQFDLSSIPAGAQIVSAKLSLYAHTTSSDGYLGTPTYGTDNATELKRVTSAWDENTVTWNTQPASTSTGQVLLPQSTNVAQDYTDMDITAFVQYWSDNPTQNYGMLLDIITNNHYNSLIFCSSDHPDAAKRPKLEICYNTVVCATLQPDAAAGKDVFIHGYSSTQNFGADDDLIAERWTWNGSPNEMQGLIEFDLSTIPVGAQIISANLSLYAHTGSNDGYAGTPTYGNDNAAYLKRVTTAWDENTVTWNNAPTATTTGQVLLPQSTSTAQDYSNIDISAFVQHWVDNPGQNYGMLLDMITNNHYNSLIFCSSDHPDAAKRPKLDVCYTIATSCVVIQPDELDGKDAVLHGHSSTYNFGNDDDLIAERWTWNGSPNEMQSLLQFDLSSIPASSVIVSAKLSLYANTASGDGYANKPTYGTNNACELKRVTTAWDENTVTWNTQPSVTSAGQVSLPQSTSETQDYTDIDVSGFVQYWVDYPAQNYGLLIDMITNSHYNSMIFCSSGHSNAAKRPKLEVCYKNLSTAISESQYSGNLAMQIFPNPVAGNTFKIVMPGNYNGENVDLRVLDLTGREVSVSGVENHIDYLSVAIGDNVTPGTYIVSAVTNAGAVSGKISIIE